MMEIRDLPFQFVSAMRSFSFDPSFVVEEARKRLTEMNKARADYDSQVAEVLGKYNIKTDEKTLARLDRIPPYGQITPELRDAIKWRTRSRSLGALLANLEGFVRYATHSQVKGIGTVGRIEESGVALNLDECRSMLEPFDVAKFEAMFRQHDEPEAAMGVHTAMAHHHGYPMPAGLAALQEVPADPVVGIEALSGG